MVDWDAVTKKYTLNTISTLNKQTALFAPDANEYINNMNETEEEIWKKNGFYSV